MHSWLIRPRGRFYDVVREERGIYTVVADGAGLSWEDAVALRHHHELRDPPPRAEIVLMPAEPRYPNQPARRKFAVPKEIQRAARSRVEWRRPFCTACEQWMPSPDSPREMWMERLGHRDRDREPCPGGGSALVVLPPTDPRVQAAIAAARPKTDAAPRAPVKAPRTRPSSPRPPRLRVLAQDPALRARFVREYLVDRDGASALLRAGYVATNARGLARVAFVALRDQTVLAEVALAAAAQLEAAGSAEIPADAASDAIVVAPPQTTAEPSQARDQGESMSPRRDNDDEDELESIVDESTEEGAGEPDEAPRPLHVTQDKILKARFVRSYVDDPKRNATQALLRAGFTRTNPQRAARKLLDDPGVQNAIALLIEKRGETTAVTPAAAPKRKKRKRSTRAERHARARQKRKSAPRTPPSEASSCRYLTTSQQSAEQLPVFSGKPLQHVLRRGLTQKLADKLEQLATKQAAEKPREVEVVSVDASGRVTLGDLLAAARAGITVISNANGLRVSVSA